MSVVRIHRTAKSVRLLWVSSFVFIPIFRGELNVHDILRIESQQLVHFSDRDCLLFIFVARPKIVYRFFFLARIRFIFVASISKSFQVNFVGVDFDILILRE